MMQLRVPLDQAVWVAKFDTPGGCRYATLPCDSTSKRAAHVKHVKQKSAIPVPTRNDSRRYSDTTPWSAEGKSSPNKGRTRSASVGYDSFRTRNASSGMRQTVQGWEGPASGKPSARAVVVECSSPPTIRPTSSVSAAASLSASSSWKSDENTTPSPTVQDSSECTASTSYGSRGTQTKGHRGLSVDCVKLFANETWYKKGARLMSAHATCLAEDVMVGEGDEDPNDLEMRYIRLSRPTASSRARQAEQRPYPPPKPAARTNRNQNNASTFLHDHERFMGSRIVPLHKMKKIVERHSSGKPGVKSSQALGSSTTLKDFTSLNSTYWMETWPFVE